jgi:hypothetical protein
LIYIIAYGLKLIIVIVLVEQYQNFVPIAFVDVSSSMNSVSWHGNLWYDWYSTLLCERSPLTKFYKDTKHT